MPNRGTYVPTYLNYLGPMVHLSTLVIPSSTLFFFLFFGPRLNYLVDRRSWKYMLI